MFKEISPNTIFSIHIGAKTFRKQKLYFGNKILAFGFPVCPVFVDFFSWNIHYIHVAENIIELHIFNARESFYTNKHKHISRKYLLLAWKSFSYKSIS